MDSVPLFACSTIVALSLYVVFRSMNRSSIRHIPGPPSPSWIFGHMRQLLLSPQYGNCEFEWLAAYGPVYRTQGCCGQDRLMVSDPVALQHILNSPLFDHGPRIENFLHMMFNENAVMAAKGETHKRLRAAMGAGFSAAAVGKYRSVFEGVAQTMTEQLEASTSPTDVCQVLNYAALGAISHAAFGYTIQDLGEEFVAINTQTMALSCSQSAAQIVAEAITNQLPKWVGRAMIHLPTRIFNILRASKHLSNQLGRRIVREKVEAGQKGIGSEMDVYDMLLEQEQSNKRRNTLTADEIAAQTGIILVGGQDTTANTMALGLVELARNPEFQQDLRSEILSARGGAVEYDSMPLLNAFIKEVLRFYPTGPLQERAALQDTVIPLADGLKISTGEVVHEIRVSKGQVVVVAVASYHRLTSLWGEDAHEFKPSRWIDGPAFPGHAVGPYANLLSFLGGPRVCLGWRFALLEMQVFFCELVGNFSFALQKDAPIRTHFANTLIPVVENGEKAAPLCITRI